MQIAWKGKTCVLLNAQKAKQEQIRIVFDPFAQDAGLKPPSVEADIALITNEHGMNTKALKGEPFLVEHSGEYEVAGVFIQGISSTTRNGKTNTIYVLDVEGMRVCHLGQVGQDELTPEQVGAIGGIDILFIPVGGGEAVEAKEAAKIVNQIEPRMAIPMHYAVAGAKEKLGKVEEFLEVMGTKDAQKQAKLSIKARDLPSEDTEIAVLTT